MWSRYIARASESGGIVALGEYATRAAIETWRLEYNVKRPKKTLRGPTPAQYAKQLAIKAATMPGLKRF
jgi:hypothetical protein